MYSINTVGTDILPVGFDIGLIEPVNPGAPMRRPRAFDASEGTALDPLRNKTYDLSYAKTLPRLQ